MVQEILIVPGRLDSDNRHFHFSMSLDEWSVKKSKVV